jgi:hypothetical protein
MSAPNRAAETAAVINAHPEFMGQGDEVRAKVLPYICDALNRLDNGQWGLLQKDTGVIPSDIIVYKDTREHFDVIRGVPPWPYWEHKGIIQDNWKWIAAPAVSKPEPNPEPNPSGSDELLSVLIAALTEMKGQVSNLEQSLEQLKNKGLPIKLVIFGQIVHGTIGGS